MRVLALAVGLLTGCVGTAPQPPAVSGPMVPFRLDGEGIEAVGTGQRIDFGRHRPGVIETMTRLQGRAPVALSGPDICGVGLAAARWDDGLVLVFRDDAFRGWTSSDGDRVQGATCTGA